MSETTIAKISKDALVVSFKGAKTLTVWRARLETLDDAGFKIETAGKGNYSLRLTRSGNAKGEEIAAFTTKATAEEALGEISDVLFHADDMMAQTETVTLQNQAALAAPAKPMLANAAPPVETAATPERSVTGWRVLYWFVFAVIFFVMFYLMLKAFMNVPNYLAADTSMLPEAPNQATMGGDLSDMPEPPEGRPLSADDFFNNRGDQ